MQGLTTGGLPTFVDVGNSFGAPAIAEDNLIYQVRKIMFSCKSLLSWKVKPFNSYANYLPPCS